MKITAIALLLLAPCTSVPAALIAEWRLDEASGGVVDSTGNHPIGIPTGVPDYGQPGVTPGLYGSIIVTAPAGRSIGFGPQTVDEYFTIGTTNINPVMDLAPSSNFTVMGWINPNAPTGSAGYRFLSTGTGDGAGGGWGFSLFMPNATGVGSAVRFTTHGIADNQSSAFNVTFGQWIHLAATYRNGAIDYFLNGSPLTGSDFSLFNNDTAAGRLVLGGRFSGPNFDQANGRLDGIRVYNTALTASQIIAAASASAVPEPRNAMVYLTISTAMGSIALRRRRRSA